VTNATRFRAAEARLWHSVGVTPSERLLSLRRTGAQVRVLTVGQGAPAVFIHGASNAASSWVDLAARLPGRECVLVERPGCGLSPRLPHPLRDPEGLRSFAADFLVDVLDAMEVPTADVIATSLGGFFALHGTAATPGRVRRLVTLGYSIGAPIERVATMMRMSGVPGVGRLMARLTPPRAAIKPMLRQIGLRHAVDSGAFNDVMIDWFLSLLRDTPTMLNELRDLPPVILPLRGLNESVLLTDELLKRVEAPTLMLWGRDDPFGGESVGRAFAPRLPNALLEVVDGGHAPWIDNKDGIAERVDSFLGA
jgi:pimeloyl-ACP methyl ester carboxylesterase